MSFLLLLGCAEPPAIRKASSNRVFPHLVIIIIIIIIVGIGVIDGQRCHWSAECFPKLCRGALWNKTIFNSSENYHNYFGKSFGTKVFLEQDSLFQLRFATNWVCANIFLTKTIFAQTRFVQAWSRQVSVWSVILGRWGHLGSQLSAFIIQISSPVSSERRVDPVR